MLQECSYIRSALGDIKPTLITAALLSILYGYLYILLQNADFALLMGSIGTFAILAVVMYFSRRIDWYGLEFNG